ncbi:MAG: T9SS type A sorting domain-containing protein, partial [Ferruginibacter sp.]
LGTSAVATTIGGTVNIAANYTANNTFTIKRLINQTTGGTINIQNTLGFDIQKDTLKVASCSLTGYTGNNYAYFLNNAITGNVTIADNATYTTGYTTYIRNNVITGTSSFTKNGTNELTEAEGGSNGNTYNGNTSFTANNSGALIVSSGSASTFNGNLTVSRTVAGATSLFSSGAVITVNFSYTNNTSGASTLGNLAFATTIAGTVNIAANYSSNSAFAIYRLINQTTGGTINIQNTTGFDIQKDTLKINSILVTGYTGNAYGYFYNNSIAGNVTIADNATYTTGYATYIHNNVITGTSSFTKNGTNEFNEADVANTANTYNGNASFTATNSGGLQVSYGSASTFNGNLTISRTVAGATSLFNSGAVITGNFSYTNNTSGVSTLGTIGVATTIGGTVNIAAGYITNSSFAIFRLINQTTGGTINIQNSTGFNIQKDTLKVISFSVTGYKTGAYAYFYNNSITGNVTIADDASYSGGYSTTVYNNIITGTSSFTNNGTNVLYDADVANTANTYNGNTSFTATNSGGLNVSNGSASNFNGNLTVNRTATGATQFFNAGAAITGNFSYTNNTSGASTLGNNGVATTIAGTVNIAAIYTSNSAFAIFRLINQTTGGIINIQNTTGFNIQKDTLKVISFSVTGYKTGAYSYFYNNSITGNVTIADDATYGGGYNTTVYNNVITGNSSFTNNGTNTFYDADVANSGNKYIGGVTYIRNGGPMTVAVGSIDEITGNLTLNSTTSILLSKIKFNGATDGVVDQLGTQPITISELTMEKTGTGKITLNDSVTVTGSLTFNGGNINASAGNNLIFPDNIGYTGVSATSHVIGPVTKIGDDVFTFPVGGQNSQYAPISITAPAIVTDRFRAQYFNTNPHPLYDTTLRDPTLNHVSGQEYWLLDRITGTSNVKVTESWNATRGGIVNSLPDLRVARWNGSTWKDEGNGGTTGTNASGTVQSLNPVTNFSPFTLASATPLNPLPVTLISFAASKCNTNVCLLWATENEQDFSHFELEKSSDGRNFLAINTVLARNAVGRNNYTAADINPLNGINYYRLKIIDKDGKYNYSIVLRIDFTKKYLVSILPNPAHNFILINGADNFKQIQLLDASGKTVKQFAKTANNQYNITGLPKGVYLLRLLAEDERQTQKIIIE